MNALAAAESVIGIKHGLSCCGISKTDGAYRDKDGRNV